MKMKSTINFLSRCGRKFRPAAEDEGKHDDLFSEVMTCSTERGAWFYTALASSSYEARGSIIGSAALDNDLKRVSEAVSLKERASLTPMGVSPRAFTIKAYTEESKPFFPNIYIILESIPICKMCNGSLGDLNEILLTLDNNKVTKVLNNSEKQQELYGCRLCNKTTADDEHMRIHLLKHIESNEVACDHCECVPKRNPPKRESIPTLFIKSFERVSLSQIIVSCRLCNTIVQSCPIIFPEAVTIKLSTDPMEIRCCAECGCQLNPAETNTEYFTFEPDLCDPCTKNVAKKLKEVEENWSSSESMEFTSVTDDKGLPTVPRNIHVTSKNLPFKVEPKDFLIKDKAKDDNKTWYTCRFCGDSLPQRESMVSHVRDHLAIEKVVCDDCCTGICWY